MDGGFSLTPRLFLEIAYFLTWLLIPHVVFHKRHPVSVWAWIWAILLFPVVGGAAYVLFGTNRISRKALRRKSRARFAAERRESPASAPEPSNGLPPEAARQVAMIEGITGRRMTRGNSVELLIDAGPFYDRLIRDIDAAVRHVHLEFYIWRADDTGRRLLDALIRAALRGVEVRLLLDEVGSMNVSARFFEPLREAGGRFSWFLSLHFPGNSFFINLRNHRKNVVIDGAIACCGGINVGDEYLGRDAGIGDWHDTHLRVEGPAVRHVQEIFADDWFFATGEKLLAGTYYPERPPAGSSVVHVIEDGPDTEMTPLYMTLIDLITQARNRVWIETPYFIPYPDLVAILQMAALKGVDVRLILSGKLDHPYLLWISRSWYEDLLKAGVRIFEYQKGMLHSKLLVADGIWTFAGSANLDIRSFRLNFETNLAVYDPSLAEQAAKILDEDLLQSSEVVLGKFEKRPWTERVKESVLRLLAPAV